MSDERPRPQFGEYATREEQLARIQSPSPEQLDPTPARRETTPASQANPAPTGRATFTDPALIEESRRQFRNAGTLAFLVYGFIQVVTNVPAFINLNLLINQELAVVGDNFGVTFPVYPAGSATTVVGYALVALWTALWLGAALLVWRRIRAGKRALWVPIVAGIVANTVATIAIFALLSIDPEIANQLMTVIRGNANL